MAQQYYDLKRQRAGSYSKAAFLREHAPAGLKESTFRGWLKEFGDGAGAEGGEQVQAQAQAAGSKRRKVREFVRVEELLVAYVRVRQRKIARDKIGLSWALLQQKALQFAQQVLADQALARLEPPWPQERQVGW